MLERFDNNDLDKIIYSDEKTFSTDVSWRTKVYRPNNARYAPEYVKNRATSDRITAAYGDVLVSMEFKLI